MNKHLLLTIASMLFVGALFSQQKVKDRTVEGNTLPNGNAILELESTNKGLLHTRVMLTSSTEATPLSQHVAGMMVYNTATANDVVPGIYYNDGTKWVLAGTVTNGANNISYNPTSYEISYVDDQGNTQTIDLQEIVRANETVTMLANNGDGTYTYTSEAGTETMINVPADVISNFEEILNNEGVRNELIEQLTNTSVGGNVYYDGTAFTYVDGDGNTQTIDFGDLVQANETVTTLVSNGGGTYTYTSEDGTAVTFDANTSTVTDNGDGTYTITNADGTTVTIDVAGDVLTEFQDNTSDIYTEIQNIITAGSDALVDNGDGTFTHTAADGTEVTFDGTRSDITDNGDGTYTVIGQDGTPVTIDVTGDVLTDLQDNTSDIYNEIRNIITAGSDALVDNGDGTFTHTAADGTVVSFDANTTTVMDNGDGTYTVTGADGTTVVIDTPGDVLTDLQDNTSDIYTEIQNIVTANETLTALVNNTDGTYTYYNEAGIDAAGNPIPGSGVAIDIPADVISNFETIIGDADVLNELIEQLTSTSVGGNVYYDGTAFTYVDAAGDTQTIDLGDLVKANETLTALVNNTDGTYTYYNEAGIDAAGNPIPGSGVAIDIPADVISNFETIIGDADVLNELIEQLTSTSVGGNVYYDGTAFTYVDAAGDTQTIDLGDLVKANETLTALVNNTDGTYTYYNEAGIDDAGNPVPGSGIVIDIPADVISNFETIIGDADVLNELIEQLTNTSVGGNVYYDGTSFTYVDAAGDPQSIDFGDLVQANETVTTLVNNTDGTYTYYNEAGIDDDGNPVPGSGIVIDIPADVISNFETIIGDADVLNELIEQLTSTSVGGNVYYDGTSFTYVDAAGDTQSIDFGDLVQANETVTTLVNNTDGTYTYYNEAGIDDDGNPVPGSGIVIDIPADVISNFETIIGDADVLNELIEQLTSTSVGGNVYYDGTAFTYVDAAGDTQSIDFGDLVQANETVTTLVNNTDGTYTYYNEAGIDDDGNPVPGSGIVIDIPADVISNFETIIGDADVLNELIEQLTSTSVGGNVYYDGTSFTYVDAAGDPQSIDFGDLVQANETVTTLVNNTDGTYTYTSEDGTPTTFDVTQSGVGDPTTAGTTGTAGDIYVDESTGDIYTNDGTTWKPANVNIYNSDGALTGDRILDLNGSSLEFAGTNQQTGWSPNGGITQNNLLPSSGSASMGFLGGNNTNLYVQAFYGGSTQVIASGNATNFVIGTGYTANPTFVRFDTSPGGGLAPNPAIYITSEGYLGIGSDGLDASEKLDVTAGNARIRDINTNVGASTDNIVVADADGVLKTVATDAFAIEPWQVQGTTDKATDNAQEIYQTGSIAIGTNEIPVLSVDGENLTSTVKLHVDGNITSTGRLYTTNSLYADYVFEKYFNGHSDLNAKYEFASLNDVKKFITKNHHLPGITRIADLSKSANGYTFDLTSLSIQQLEKIEELFIHTIEQQELLDKQQAQLEKQQKELAELKEKLAKIEQLLGQQ